MTTKPTEGDELLARVEETFADIPLDDDEVQVVEQQLSVNVEGLTARLEARVAALRTDQPTSTETEGSPQIARVRRGQLRRGRRRQSTDGWTSRVYAGRGSRTRPRATEGDDLGEDSTGSPDNDHDE